MNSRDESTRPQSDTNRSKSLPSSSRVVIIGGGIIGCSSAYHLAQLGCETMLLEQHQLTSGSTFHAAGLIGQLRSSASVTRLLGESVSLYQSLEHDTGYATGWKMNGGLRLACTEDRWIELKRQASTAKSLGIDMQLLTPSEAQSLWPLMQVDDLVGAGFLVSDGQASPSDITQSLAHGARQAGALIFENTRVTDLVMDAGRITGVVTEQGPIKCEKVLCCAGQWTREFAARYGVSVPLISIQHQYVVTDTIPGVDGSLPSLRDPDRLTYYKEDVGGLAIGGYEHDPRPWAETGVPEDFNYTLLDFDMDHFEPMMFLAMKRIPLLSDTRIKEVINGPESFTPDGNFIIGEAPELKNFFVGAGFNAFGIAAGGGTGMALAEWIHKGQPPFDLWPVDIRRFGQPHRDVRWVRQRALEAYSKHYSIAWPEEEYESARPNRRSPLYDILAANGACFGEKLGWERPNWFLRKPNGRPPVDNYSFTRPNWFDAVAREHCATRERVVLIDQSSFAKFLLQGPDALPALEWLSAVPQDKPVGSLTYTQMLNQHGGIECDLVVARLREDQFYLVTGTGVVTRAFHWIKSNLPMDARAELVDISTSRGVISLMGPSSRTTLQNVCSEPLDNPSFPFGTLQTLHIDGCPVLALRISYVGELGWELHVPIECMVSVYQALHAAGRPHGLINSGYRALESCRLEKAYRAWGSDIGPDHSPIEAGLGERLKMPDSDRPFLGMEALARQRTHGPRRLLAGFSIDGSPLVLAGRETIYQNGQRVGWLTSGGYGHTVGRAVGYGYINHRQPPDPAELQAASYQLEIASTRHDCQLHLEALYDPENLRPRS